MGPPAHAIFLDLVSVLVVLASSFLDLSAAPSARRLCWLTELENSNTSLKRIATTNSDDNCAVDLHLGDRRIGATRDATLVGGECPSARYDDIMCAAWARLYVLVWL